MTSYHSLKEMGLTAKQRKEIKRREKRKKLRLAREQKKIELRQLKKMYRISEEQERQLKEANN